MVRAGLSFGALRTYYRRQARANVSTHALGMLASIAGGITLIVLASLGGSPWQLVSAAIYAATLVLLYLASTLYHSARDRQLRRRLKVLDHCAIYLLIAGTYTPFTLVALRGGWGWTLFGLIWGLAVAGMVFKLFFTGRFKRTSTALYVAMGWICLIAIVPLVKALSDWAFAWLLAGGVAYTSGTLFYHASRIPYSHAIWHLFVLAGSGCHFVAVCSQVLPGNAA